MGKGDKKTRRGKITIGSYGKTRVHKAPTTPVDTDGKKKASAKKTKGKK